MKFRVLLLAAIAGAPVFAQASAPNPMAAGAGSSVPIESEMIGYEALNELARELANVVSNPVLTTAQFECFRSLSNDETAYYKAHKQFSEHEQSKLQKEKEKHVAGDACLTLMDSGGSNETPLEFAPNFVLGSPTNMAAVAAYEGFQEFAGTLTNLYNEKAHKQQQFESHFAEIAPAIGTLAGALSALRGTTTQGGATFTPVDQALYSDLEREFKIVHREFITMPYPGQYANGNRKIAETLVSVANARRDAVDYLKNHSPRKAEKGYDPLASELKDYEPMFASVEGVLTGANEPSISLGAALLEATGPKQDYDVLSIANTAVGGGERTNTYFLLNLFIPAPHPSYNGGAIVSYTIRGKEGEYKTSGMLRLVYGYTKWKETPLRDKSNRGSDNFQWDRKYNKGRWVPVY